MEPKRIIITAQGYGFGPASKAGSIASYLKRTSGDIFIDFMGDGIAFDLATSKKELFDNIYPVKNEFEIEKVLKNGNYNLLVSVMEPKAIMVAKNYPIKSVLVDSLFWFWNWGSFLEKNSISKIKEDFSISVKDLPIRFSEIHPHETQLVSYIFADKRFIQAYPNSCSRKDLNLSDFGEYQIVGPIIDDTYLNPKTPKSRLIISVCGQKNPEVDNKKSLEYCRFVLSLLSEGLSELLKKSPNIKPILVGHPEIMGLLKQELIGTELEYLEVRHLTHEEYYKTINSAIAVIGPPSITTMFECYAYGKPYIFLPEQNTSHWPNYSRITDQYFVNSGKSREDVFPGVLITPLFLNLSGLDEFNIKRIYDAIKEINSGNCNELKETMKATYTKIIPLLLSEEYRKMLFMQQTKSIETFTKYPANGAKEIANQLINMLKNDK
jgi:hypothetical protein